MTVEIPGATEDQIRSGQSAFSDRRWAEAADYWLVAVQSQPRNASLLHSLGMALFHLGRRDEALSFLRRSTDIEDARPEYWATLAEALAASGHRLEARNALSKGLHGAGPDWGLRLRFLKLAVKCGTGADLRELFFTCHRIISTTDIQDREAAFSEIRNRMLDASASLFTAQRFDDAEHVLDLGLRFFPTDSSIRTAYIRLLFYAGDWRRCAIVGKNFSDDLELKPSLLYMVARASARSGEMADAVALTRRAWSLDPGLAMISRRHFRPPELQGALNSQANARRVRLMEIATAAIVSFAALVALFPGAAAALLRSPLFFVVCLGPVLAEILMRIALWWRRHNPGEGLILPVMPEKVTDRTIHILGHASVRYHEKSGFSYYPSATFARGYFENGRITTFSNVTVDPHGSLGDSSNNYETSQIRSLVFGDSFTVNLNSHTGLHWPHFFATKLRERTGRSVAAVNFGREFFGVLQMVGLAAELVPTWKPDFIIIAYITRDLARPRSWAHRAFVGGRERFLRAFSPGEPVNVMRAFDAHVVEPAATYEWFSKRFENQDVDELLKSAVARHIQLKARGDYRCLHVLDFRTSVLLNTLFYGDPLERFPYSSPRERWMISDRRAFQTDKALHADVETLKKSGSRIVLLHIPAREEIIARQEFLATKVDLSLKSDLEALFGVQTIELLPYILREKFDMKDFCINDEDDHPTALGERIYGSAVAAALYEQGVLER